VGESVVLERIASSIFSRLDCFDAKNRSTEVCRLRCLGLGFGDDGCLAGDLVFFVMVKVLALRSFSTSGYGVIEKDLVQRERED
jgi:hypothetical protein